MVTRLREVEPRRFVVYAVFLLIFVFFAATLHDDGFLSHTNLLNIVRQTTPITVMAVAVVFVLSAGEIDLSLRAVVALSALVTADVMQGHSAVLAIAAGLGVGIGVGVVNGLFVTALVLPSFLVTLASMGIITGVARSITDLQAVAVVNQRFVDIFGSATSAIGLAFWALGAVALGHFVFRHRRPERTSSPWATTRGRLERPASASTASAWSSSSAAPGPRFAAILYTGRLQGARHARRAGPAHRHRRGRHRRDTPVRRRGQRHRRAGWEPAHGNADQWPHPVGSHLLRADRPGCAAAAGDLAHAGGEDAEVDAARASRAPQEGVRGSCRGRRRDARRSRWRVPRHSAQQRSPSTVVNCLAGVYPPTSGRILLDGAAVQFPHPLEAHERGIEAVFEDLALADLQPVC